MRGVSRRRVSIADADDVTALYDAALRRRRLHFTLRVQENHEVPYLFLQVRDLRVFAAADEDEPARAASSSSRNAC